MFGKGVCVCVFGVRWLGLRSVANQCCHVFPFQQRATIPIESILLFVFDIESIVSSHPCAAAAAAAGMSLAFERKMNGSIRERA